MTDSDTATPATTSTVNRRRGPNERFFVEVIQGRTRAPVVTRYFGDVVEDCPIGDIPDDVWDQLAWEGYIHLRKSGATHADIRTRKDFPDRAKPTPKQGRARSQRAPGPWLKAIAQVKAKELIKAAKSGGQRVTTADAEAYDAIGLSWALSRNKEQVKALRKHKLVRLAHAELTGESGPLDDVLAAPAPSASLGEAAN